MYSLEIICSTCCRVISKTAANAAENDPRILVFRSYKCIIIAMRLCITFKQDNNTNIEAWREINNFSLIAMSSMEIL